MAETGRLHSPTAVANLRKEAALAAETLQPAATTDQAPALPLRLLEKLETTVSTPGCPRYHRGYARITLLRHWSSLRWDDSQGLPPATLERRARGVSGLLEWTKTSGPGKS